ncbi:ANTAR domain-containing protein [Streptomyces massasporeus]|uniref:ANTAR domain-containing protein n=1 Tax=Streptomyces massasporeus TaxID=67324 RepID=UPI0033D4FC48
MFLERENDGSPAHLQSAITSHVVIDQAIGVIIALGGLRPQQGFDVLRDISQRARPVSPLGPARDLTGFPVLGFLACALLGPGESQRFPCRGRRAVYGSVRPVGGGGEIVHPECLCPIRCGSILDVDRAPAGPGLRGRTCDEDTIERARGSQRW